jgi:hypothetical protein
VAGCVGHLGPAPVVTSTTSITSNFLAVDTENIFAEFSEHFKDGHLDLRAAPCVDGVVVVTGVKSPLETNERTAGWAERRFKEEVTGPATIVVDRVPYEASTLRMVLSGDAVVDLGPVEALGLNRACFTAEGRETHILCLVSSGPSLVVLDGVGIGFVRGTLTSSGEPTYSTLGSQLSNVRVGETLGPVGNLRVYCDLTLDEGMAVLDLRNGLLDAMSHPTRFLGRVRGRDGLLIQTDSRVSMSRVPDSSVVVSTGTDSVVILEGEYPGAEGTRDLTLDCEHIVVNTGIVDGLTLRRRSTTIRIGSTDDESPTEDEELVDFAVVTRVAGTVQRLVVGRRSVFSGHEARGFVAIDVEASAGSEISGIAAAELSISAIASLSHADRVGLWVAPSTKAARRQMEKIARNAESEGTLALDRLVDQRAKLLRLAVDSQQSGHTLAVLREAERDARRRRLPKGSRERRLLTLSRWAVGYGERIGWPLAVGGAVISILAAVEVGWGRLSSSEFWAGFGDHHRYEEAIRFALPGLSFFDLDGTGGLWGTLAKFASVIFLASSAAAASRVLRRRE